MNKKYVVRLSDEERGVVDVRIRTQPRPAHGPNRGRMPCDEDRERHFVARLAELRQQFGIRTRIRRQTE